MQVGDWGRDGLQNQSAVAALMATVADSVKPDFILSMGDNFYESKAFAHMNPCLCTSMLVAYDHRHCRSSKVPIVSCCMLALHLPHLLRLSPHLPFASSVASAICIFHLHLLLHIPPHLCCSCLMCCKHLLAVPTCACCRTALLLSLTHCVSCKRIL